MARITFDNPNEVKKFHAKESWVPVIFGGLIPLAICAIACVVIAVPLGRTDLLPGAVGISVVVVLASRVPHVVDNMRTDVVVTDRRLYYRYGIIDIKDHVCDLGSITDISIDPTILGRMFNYADVRIQTKAGDDDFVLREIADAYQMRKIINLGRDASEERSGDHPHKGGRPPRST